MFSLRRAAFRGLRTQSSIISPRSFASLTSQVPKVQQTYTRSSVQKRSYSDESGSVYETVTSAVKNATNAATNSLTGGRQGDAPETSILYIGNLFFDLTADVLQQKFAEYGPVKNCRIVTDNNGMSKGFGYVEFETIEQANAAVEALNQEPLMGRNMLVQPHRRRTVHHPAAPSEPTSTLFVGNMSFKMSDQELNDLFKDIKNVLDVRVAIDRRSGQPRGFAHVDFADAESATVGLGQLEGKVLHGRNLRVNYGLPSITNRKSFATQPPPSAEGSE